MALEQIVNLDELLNKWAASRLGSDYILQKLDTSKVQVSQRSILYQSSQDWWTTPTVHEEFFDNDANLPATWHYTHKVKYHSSASWTLIKAFASSKLLPTTIKLEYPVSEGSTPPLQVEFHTKDIGQQIRKTTERDSEWDLSTNVNAKPYCSAHAYAQIRTCELKNVVFTADIVLSGSLKITGHKKSKKWTKNEILANICDVFSGKENLGFLVEESHTNPHNSTRHVVFRLEGVCSGKVGVEALVKVDDIQSLV